MADVSSQVPVGLIISLYVYCKHHNHWDDKIFKGVNCGIISKMKDIYHLKIDFSQYGGRMVQPNQQSYSYAKSNVCIIYYAFISFILISIGYRFHHFGKSLKYLMVIILIQQFKRIYLKWMIY